MKRTLLKNGSLIGGVSLAMPSRWIVGIDPLDDMEQGYIIHRQAPEFVAKWTTEAEDETTASDLVYTDADDDVAIVIYDFEFDDKPSEEVFRAVCADGVRVIDTYLITTMEGFSNG